MRGGAPLQLGARPVEKEGAAAAGVPRGDRLRPSWNAGSARMRSCPGEPPGRMTGRCAGTPRLAAKIAPGFPERGWPRSPLRELGECRPDDLVPQPLALRVAGEGGGERAL